MALEDLQRTVFCKKATPLDKCGLGHPPSQQDSPLLPRARLPRWLLLLLLPAGRRHICLSVRSGVRPISHSIVTVPDVCPGPSGSLYLIWDRHSSSGWSRATGPLGKRAM